jgi:hypothetical protein
MNCEKFESMDEPFISCVSSDGVNSEAKSVLDDVLEFSLP